VCRIEVNTRVANKNWNAAVQLNRDASLVDRWRPEPWGGYLWLFDPDGEKPPTSSVRDCAQLEARLATAEERLDAVRPLRERFIELRPSTDRERIVSMRLMEAMDTASFQLECRGSICRVQTKTMRVHRIEQKKLFSRVELEKSGFESVVFVEMREDVVARGEAFMAALTAALVKQATRVAECRQKHWRRGMVVFDLLVERGMRVLLHDSGENAHSPLAKCLRTIVEESLPSVDGPIQLPGRPIRFWSH
jgi:hypothetical protein